MKKIITFLWLVVFLCVFAACSVTENETVVTENKKETEIIPISDTQKEIHFYRDNMKIHGELHLPQGEAPFPVVVLVEGFGASYDYFADKVKMLNERGCAAVVFDFIGTNNASRSGGNYLDKTLFTEVADLNVVLDEVLSWPEIDSDRLFLWGHSFGGLVATHVATQREKEIQGLVLLEPSYYMPDQFRGLFPEGSDIPVVVTEPLLVSRQFIEDLVSFEPYDEMKKFKKKVLIFWGTIHEDIELEAMEHYFGKAVETFSDAEVIIVEGADHYFMGEPGVRITEKALEVMDGIKE